MPTTLPMALTADPPPQEVKVWTGAPWDIDGWNQAWLPQAGFEVFHTVEWAQVLHAAYGYRPCFVTAARGSQTALLPCMEIDSWLTGRRGVTLPFTDSCPPLGDPGLRLALEREITRVAETRKWASLEVRGGGLWSGEAAPSVSFHRHVLALQGGKDQLFARFEGAVRRAIRKALSGGVKTVVTTDLEGMRAYYGLHCLTRRKHGLPPQPRSFFESVHRHMVAKGLGFVILAECGGKTIAGDVFFHAGGRAVYKYGASDDRWQHLRGSTLVMWVGIQHCLELGCQSLDFGRTSIGQEGLRRFKLGWGTAEGTLEYWKFSFESRSFVAERDRAEGWHNRVFRWMPLNLARWIGAAMYHHVG
jgi:hypothetical protein